MILFAVKYSHELFTARYFWVIIKLERRSSTKNKEIIILSLLCFSFFLAGCSNSSIQEELEDITYPYPDSKDVVISLEEYNQLKNGMTEDEVWEIIGGKCTNSGNTDLGMGEEYITTTYGCNGSGKTGANAILIFQGGTLNSMSQAGLK